jgi:DNA-binding LacI/PurR family transcriptional regulator
MTSDKTGLLVQALRGAIERGAYKPGSAIPSERQLMEEFSLSRTTVRRAIDELVSVGQLERRPGSGTFVTEPIRPSAAASSHSPTLALIIPTFSSPFYGEMIDGMEQEARRHDLRIMASQSAYSPDSESDHLSAAAADPAIRGAIVAPAHVDRPVPGALRMVQAGKPLVYLGRWPRGLRTDSVSTDYLVSAKLAVDHLIGLGHRRIAYVEGAPHLPGFSPFSGYHEALKEARIALQQDLVCLPDLPSEEAGQEAIAGLIRRGIDFTAVFARNDVTAVGVMRALREAGLRIPEDVSVTAINNSLLSRSLDPPVTSVDPFPSTLGRLAFRLLHERVAGIYSGPPVRMTLDPTLVVRASSGPPAKSQRNDGSSITPFTNHAAVAARR